MGGRCGANETGGFGLVGAIGLGGPSPEGSGGDEEEEGERQGEQDVSIHGEVLRDN